MCHKACPYKNGCVLGFFNTLCENSMLRGSFPRCHVNFVPWLLPAVTSVGRLAGWTAREEAPEQGGHEPPWGGWPGCWNNTNCLWRRGWTLVRDTKCFLHGIAPILSNLFPFHYDSLTQVTWIWTCVHLLPVVGFLDGIEWKGDAKLDTPGHVDLPHFPLWSRWAPPLSRLECSHTYPWISCALGNAVPISAFQ